MDNAGEHLGGEKYLTEIRIILVGNRSAGKSSAGNTILGKNEFDLKRTTHCLRRQGEVARRRVTVVEAPGWWRNYPLEETPMLIKQQIELSVSICPPGPHVFLLIIRLDAPFTKKQQRTTEEHLSLLGEKVWKHTIVLFISGNQLEDSNIEQHITQEKALSCLIERCGDRYHILNSRRMDDGTQVTRLLEKIDEMVTDNNGLHYTVNTERVQQLEEKRREIVGQMKGRMEKVEQQRTVHRTLRDSAFPLSKLRILLLGYRASGKSSAGNTILEKKAFDLKTTAQCVKRQGNIEGREITLVEAPGWWRNYPLRNTSRLIREEIEFSVSLCAPGPHAILLAVRVDYSFTETHRRALEEHLDLLGERVWNHTIVLFTFGDWLGDTPIEEHIESEGEDLQWLVERCGTRYHVINCRSSDQKQVTDLLEKIEETVALNSRHLYKIKNERIVELEEQKRKNKEEIIKRLEKTQRKVCRTLMHDALPLSELRIVVLGYTAAGKTSAANTILGRKEFDLRRTAQCVKRQGEVAGRKITVVEAPGWERNCPLSNTPKLTTQEIELSVSLCTPGPHAVLLVIPLDTAFTDTNMVALKQHLELLSERIWSHTMVLFTGADLLGDVVIEEHIEREGKALKWVIEKCENRYHVLNNEDTDIDTQVKELLEKISDIVAKNGVHFYKTPKKIFDERAKMDMQNRAKERAMKVKTQRENQRVHMGNAYHLSDVRIMLLGHAGAGKRSAGNTILGKEEFDSNSTTQCVKREADIAGRHVTLVKPPGWWRNDQMTKTSDITKQIVLGLSQCSPGPHAILLVIRVDIAFTEKKRRALEQHLQYMKTPKVWQHVFILFTCGDWLGGTTIEQHIESEGHHLKQLVDKCGNRYHVLNNKQRGDSAQVKELLEKIEEMVAVNHGKLLQLVISPQVGTLTAAKRAESYELLPPNMSTENISETSSARGSQASLQSVISSLSVMSTTSFSSQSSGYESGCSDTVSMKSSKFTGRFANIRSRSKDLAEIPENQKRSIYQHKWGGHYITRRKMTITEPTPEDNSSEADQQQRISASSEPCLLQS